VRRKRNSRGRNSHNAASAPHQGAINSGQSGVDTHDPPDGADSAADNAPPGAAQFTLGAFMDRETSAAWARPLSINSLPPQLRRLELQDRFMYMRSSWMSGPEPLQGLTAMTHLSLSQCYAVPSAGLTGLANLRDQRHLSLAQFTIPGSGELR
jgi:hypothetical protein